MFFHGGPVVEYGLPVSIGFGSYANYSEREAGRGLRTSLP